MPRTSQSRVTFGGGEIDPRLIGRTDLPMYERSLQIMENFFPTPLGGARFRDGLRTRRVLPSKRHPDRIKIVRMPGNLGQAERILVLDGSSGAGQIEAYAFPYQGNTRFVRTNVWTRSENRPSTVGANPMARRNPVPANIYQARVSFGDYAGTMLTHRSFAPLHIGISTITDPTALNSRLLLAIDLATNHLWQLSRTLPLGSEDLGNMPPSFGSPGGMAYLDDEVLVFSSSQNDNSLWLVNRSAPSRSTPIGRSNIQGVVTGFVNADGTLYAATRDCSLWRVDRNVPTRCTLVGTIPARTQMFAIPGGMSTDSDATIEGLTYRGSTIYGLVHLSYASGGDTRGAWGVMTIDPHDLATSAYSGGVVNRDRDKGPYSLATDGTRLLSYLERVGATTLVEFDTDPALLTTLGVVPGILNRPGAMAGFDITLDTTEQLGDLFDEATTRTDAQGTGTALYFTPRNYVDHLGNSRGMAAHPAAASVFLNRMIFGGSSYLPGTFIGSELWPRPAAELSGMGEDLDTDAFNPLFNGTAGEAVSTYNFYWLFYHPRKAAAREWEAVTAHDSFSYKINSQRELSIVWMVPYNNYLVIGTSLGIWIARDLAPDTPPEVTQYNNIPCADVDPVVTDFGIAYVDGSGKEVHFASLGVGFEPPTRNNALAFARHITEGTRIRQLAWQANPQRRLWVLTEAGTLAAWCFEPDTDVIGWCRVTNPRLRFCGVCVLPGDDNEVACVAAYDASSVGPATIYLTTLDGRDHLDLGRSTTVVDFADDALVPTDPVDEGPDDEGIMTISPLTVTIRELVQIFEGGSSTLTATTTGGNGGPIGFRWSIVSGPGTITGAVNPVTYNAPASVDSSRSVTVRVEALQGEASATDDMTFTVLERTAPPADVRAVITGGTSGRVGQDITLTCEVYVDGVRLSNVAGYTFNWELSGTSATLIANGRTANFTGNQPGSARVSCTASGPPGSGSDDHAITVTSAPATLTASISAPNNIVEGDSATLTCNVGGSATGPITYAWSLLTGTGTITGSGASVTFTAGLLFAGDPIGSASVQVRVTRGGQETTAAHIFLVVANLTLTAEISGPSSLAENEQGTWTVSVGGTITGTITYQWTIKDGWGTEYVTGTSSSITWTAPQGLAYALFVLSGGGEVDVLVYRGNLAATDSVAIAPEA